MILPRLRNHSRTFHAQGSIQMTRPGCYLPAPSVAPVEPGPEGLS